MGVLTIKLKSISNLMDDDGIGKSDPYVAFELEKDKWVFDKTLGKHKSSKKKNQTSPVYNETFSFPNVPTTNNMKLHINVFDDDIGIDDKLGGCTIDLEDLHLNEKPKPVEKLLQSKKGGWFAKEAKVFIEISFEDA